MKRFLLGFVAGMWVMSSACVLMAQDCEKIVSDGAGVLSARTPDIEKAAQDLIDEGADVKVLTVAHTLNLDMDVAEAEQHCTQWRAPNGGMKSTLVVLAVAPTDHKMGIYYGGAWKHALDDHFARFKQQYMGPYFKSGDFAGGFIATEKQIAARIHASKSEALTPAVSTTVVQPTDYSGLWKFLEWSLLAVILILLVWGGVLIYKKRKLDEEEVLKQRQRAINARNQVTTALHRMSDKLKGLDATEAETRTLQAHFDNISEMYSGMASRDSFDPDVEGLPASSYEVMAKAFEDLYEHLMNLPSRVEPEPELVKEAPHKKYKTTRSKAETAAAVSASANTTVVTGMPMPIPIPIPIPIEEPVIVEEEEHRRRRKDDDDEPSSSSSSSSWSSGSSSSSDDSGGGSSSWGGSDDNSSSGGGGSSDFGGGDSGSSGGGSSDF